MVFAALHEKQRAGKDQYSPNRKDKVKGKSIAFQGTAVCTKQGTNPEFSTQTELCRQIAESGGGSPSYSQFPVRNRGDLTCKLLYKNLPVHVIQGSVEISIKKSSLIFWECMKGS